MENLQSHLEQYKANYTALQPLLIEVARLKDEASKLQKENDALENLIDAEMQNIGEQKISMWDFAVSYRKSSALKVFDETLIPSQFFVQVPKRLDAEIKKAIQNGQLIAGAEIEERQNIQIKF